MNYRIKCYKGRDLELEVTHRNWGSFQVEMSVCRDRLARGDFSKVKVIEHVNPYRQSEYYTANEIPEPFQLPVALP